MIYFKPNIFKITKSGTEHAVCDIYECECHLRSLIFCKMVRCWPNIHVVEQLGTGVCHDRRPIAKRHRLAYHSDAHQSVQLQASAAM